MAEKLDTYTFAGPGRTDRYPWNEWLDGSIYRLKRGEDFDSSPRVFRQAAYGAARRRGMAVRSSMDGEGVLVIQAYADGNGTP